MYSITTVGRLFNYVTETNFNSISSTEIELTTNGIYYCKYYYKFDFIRDKS